MTGEEKAILIINAAGVRGSQTEIVERQTKYLPYSTAVIVARLRKEGFKAAHRDLRNTVTPALPAQLTFEDFEEWLIHHEKTRRMAHLLGMSVDLLPDLSTVGLIGISVFTHNNYPYALALAKEIKGLRPEIPICLGGCFVTIKNLDIPDDVDFLVKGNGGDPICHLARHFIRGAPFAHDTPGLVYSNNGRITDNGRNQESPESEDLPDFSDLDLNQYVRKIPRRVLRSDIDATRDILIVPYRASLGCRGKCSFCTGRLVDRLGSKSVQKVLGEIKQLIGLHENILIRFCDSSINNNPKMIEDLCDALIREGIRFNWNGYVKASNITNGLLEKFARTGCNLLAWGLENASPRMIRVFHKKFDPDRAAGHIQKAAALGIQNVIFLILNGPGERMEDLDHTETFVRRLLRFPNVTFQFGEFILEEGSEIYANPETFGIEILSRPQKNDYTRREKIRWKEAGLAPEVFKEKQRRRTQRRKRMVLYQRTVKYLQKRGVRLPEPFLFLFCRTAFRLLEILSLDHHVP